jgi:hypothetical protein
MRDLLIIIPTRGRPDGLRRVVDAIRATAVTDPQILACLDRDDAAQYEPIEGVWYMIKERRRFVALTNDAARLYANDFRYLGLVGDDFVPRTEGWDAAVVTALEELGTGLCYGNDLLQGAALPTACFFTSDIVRTLGFLTPPALVHMFSDNYWLELGRQIERIRYLPDVVIEHLHPSAGKAPSDGTYEDSDARMDEDRAAFDRYMREGFGADVAKLSRYLSGAGEAPAPVRLGSRGTDAATVPILITCYNRVEALRPLVSWLEAAGHERIILVDNASTYAPLLAYYDSTPHQVHRLGANLGHLAVWEAGVLDELGLRGPYVVTDCDVVPDDDAPADALEYFADLLFRYADVDKVGFGLRIDDLPERYRFRSEVIAWESQFWEAELEPGVYRADIDTTFALYRATMRGPSMRALRTGPPYVARHLPWYTDSQHLSEEDRYYRDNVLAGVSNWDTERLPQLLLDKIDARLRGAVPEGGGAPGDPGGEASGESPSAAAAWGCDGEAFEALVLTVSDELATERTARRSAETELAAVRATRSYRWLEPARRLRARRGR